MHRRLHAQMWLFMAQFWKKGIIGGTFFRWSHQIGSRKTRVNLRQLKSDYPKEGCLHSRYMMSSCHLEYYYGMDIHFLSGQKISTSFVEDSWCGLFIVQLQSITIHTTQQRQHVKKLNPRPSLRKAKVPASSLQTKKIHFLLSTELLHPCMFYGA